MPAVLKDIHYAIRLLRRSPAFAGTATLTLALAIGANAAIFSAVKGILVAPLPYPDPDRLVRLFEEAPTTPHFPMAPADFRDYRAELQTFDGIAAYRWSVGQRKHEFGVRQALGATRCDIMRLVFSSGTWMTVTGLAAGAALSLGSTRLLGSLLHGVTPFDPATFAGVAAILVAAAGGAAYLPARRATRISAATALRGGDYS